MRNSIMHNEGVLKGYEREYELRGSISRRCTGPLLDSAPRIVARRAAEKIVQGLEPSRGAKIRYSSRFLHSHRKAKGYVCVADHRLTTETP